MSTIELGVQYASKQKVTKEHLASAMGSGDMEVFATPALVALMENAAMLSVVPYLEEGQTTVGTMVSTSHIKATAPNSDVEAVATVVAVEGKKISFSIIARDGEGVIGEAKHDRFIVDRERFLAKL